MNFNVKKAEAIYTGGGIYVFAGITTEGHHFLASDDPEWVMLTNEPTMTDEMDNEAWNDMWYLEWMEAHTIYETQTEEEARTWLLTLYNWLMENGEGWLRSDIEVLRDTILEEIEGEEYDLSFLDTIETEINFEISECDMPLQKIIKAVEDRYPGFTFNRTEARYDSCLMAIFEKK